MDDVASTKMRIRVKWGMHTPSAGTYEPVKCTIKVEQYLFFTPDLMHHIDQVCNRNRYKCSVKTLKNGVVSCSVTVTVGEGDDALHARLYRAIVGIAKWAHKPASDVEVELVGRIGPAALAEVRPIMLDKPVEPMRHYLARVQAQRRRVAISA